jgi:hypothetical protein
LRLLAIELDEHLTGMDAIAEVREHRTDNAVGFR